MIIKQKKLALLLILVLPLFLSGCIFKKKTVSPATRDGGFFASADKGEKWAQRVSIPSVSGAPKTIGDATVSAMVMDPNDSKAIYIGTIDRGLFYTYNQGVEWQAMDTLNLQSINDIVVDPKNKCNIYVAGLGRLVKSDDCGRNWKDSYVDNNATAQVNTVAVDHYNNSIVYIGTSRGELVKSIDGGVSWRTIFRPGSPVKKIAVSPHDSRIIFATSDDNLFLTKDSGDNWVNFRKAFTEMKMTGSYYDIEMPKTRSGLVYLVKGYFLLTSNDFGDTWDKVSLIAPEKKAVINDVAVNDNDLNEVYYVTDNVFYKTVDGGKTWSPKKITTTGKIKKVLVDQATPANVFVGVYKKPPKK